MAERIFKGGEYLVAEVTCNEVFTPEDFTDEQKQIAETTEQFVTNDILPHAEEIEHQNFDLVVEGMHKCGELGLLMIDAPEEYGGLELDKATSMLVGEKIGTAGSFSVAYAAHTGIGTLPLVYYGTAAQKEKYLEKIISGEWIAAHCLTEPESGSDALGARATATLPTAATHPQWHQAVHHQRRLCQPLTVFAKIDKEHFTAFLIEKD
jgi:alkylation response protein AidB-like acyl-CoA dehydrogenase